MRCWKKSNRHISAEQTELSEKINQISRHVSTEQTSALEQINKLLSSNARLPAPSAASAEARLPDILASCLQTEAYTAKRGYQRTCGGGVADNARRRRRNRA